MINKSWQLFVFAVAFLTACSQRLPAVVNLVPSSSVSLLSGSSPLSEVGFVVVPAGDINFDGNPDLAIAAPSTSLSTRTSACGQVLVLFGSDAIFSFVCPPPISFLQPFCVHSPPVSSEFFSNILLFFLKNK